MSNWPRILAAIVCVMLFTAVQPASSQQDEETDNAAETEVVKPNQSKDTGENDESQIADKDGKEEKADEPAGVDERITSIEKRLEQIAKSDEDSDAREPEGSEQGWPLSAIVIIGLIFAGFLYVIVQQFGTRRNALARIEDLSIAQLETSIRLVAKAPVIEAIRPETGRATGNEHLTIIGRNFSEATEVYFDGERCTLELVSSTRLVFTSPETDTPEKREAEIVVKSGSSDALRPYSLQHSKLEISGGIIDSAGGWQKVAGTGLAGSRSSTVDGVDAELGRIDDTEVLINFPASPAKKNLTVEITRNDGATDTKELTCK